MKLQSRKLPEWGRLLRRWLLYFLSLAMILFVWRWEILDSPPYWDAIFGLWMEANFLEITDFDYNRLRYAEKHGTIGGAYSYMTSILPTLLAVALRLVGNDRTVLILYHCLNLCCAAAIGATVGLLVERTAGTWASVLTIGALITTPVFSAQIDMASMELPLTLIVLWGGVCALRGWWKASLGLAFIAFLIKQTGMLLVVTNLGFLLLSLILFRRQRWGKLGNIAIALGILAIDAAIIEWGGTLKFHLDPRNRPEIAGPASALVWFPDLVVLLVTYGLANLGSFVHLYERQFARHPEQRFLTRLWHCGRIAVRGDAVRLYGWIFVITVLLATTRIVLIPRYVIVTLPFFFFIVAYTLFDRRMPGWFGIAFLVGLVAVNLTNQYGQLYPSIARGIGPQYARTGAMLERSREYLEDHESNIRAMRLLAEKVGDRPIFAGHPFVYVLAIPRMGYVEQPLRGYAINEFSESFPDFADILQADFQTLPDDPLFVSVPSTYYFKSIQLAVPSPLQRKVWYDDGLSPPLQIYSHDIEGADNPQHKANWYLQRLLPWGTPEERARTIGMYFGRRGETDRELEVLRTGLDAYLPSKELAIEIGKKYMDQRKPAAAITSFLQAPPIEEGREEAKVTLETTDLFEEGLELLQAGSDVAAINAFSQVVSEEGRSPVVRAHSALALGCYDYNQGRIDRAGQNLRLAISHAPDMAEAHQYLGLVEIETGRLEDARESLNRAAELGGNRGEIAAALGLIAAKQGENAIAIQHFEAALQANPALHSAQRSLRRLVEEPDSHSTP